MNLTLVIFMCERLFLTPTIHMSDKKYFQKFLINTIIKSLITFSIFHNNGKRKSSLWSHGKIDTLLISLKYRAIRGPKLFLYIRVFVRLCAAHPDSVQVCKQGVEGYFIESVR